ncbi:glycoside hydrolase family 66 protein [Paenibacillus roseipurpureus]|uniref:Glycoside hydrolase family 66 protein n=1 Tax=Paenibacillus roseopurpureus TaxID=2918901 RepID=A0AA96LRK6_9BACL|nr:glycoside hydrolase family 66 protein [Paenibacillus sp. MBLB1832]WNR45931.1 glycoside hydrolase family 66 protein [Paenibacillus sp. MBLB1832]
MNTMKQMQPYIQDVYPKKAQFIRNESITIVIEIANPTAGSVKLRLDTSVSFLQHQLEVYACDVVAKPSEVTNVELSITPKDAECNGYGVDVSLYEQGNLTDEQSTSFDVVSDWRKSIRYGFLSDFYTSEAGDTTDVAYINKLHLNVVQFYDWMYKHDDLIPPQDEFRDLMGRDLSIGVVKEKIALCHQYGMKAMAYGAVYAANKGFYEKHPDWALYDSAGKVLTFIDIFYIMNTSPASPWHQHIIGEYVKAIEQLDFDGIHMDTYGFPKTAISRLNGIEKMERLQEHFPVLIDNTRKELEQSKDDICLIFNNVGNWPVDTVGLADQNAIYVEVWHPYERYHHLQGIISRAKLVSQGKPVILAAYLKPFKEATTETMAQANLSALLLTAVIAASGGSHLLHGEKQGVLTQGYYVDHTTLEDPAFIRQIRDYYDFIIRYTNVLHDDSMRDVSMTHTDGDNFEYVFEGIDRSSYGEAGKVWTIMKENAKYKTIHFINLTNNDDLWNEGKKRPLIQKDMKVSIVLDGKARSVFMASPDSNLGRPQILEYAVHPGDKGNVLTVTIPQLQIWDVLVVEMEV